MTEFETFWKLYPYRIKDNGNKVKACKPDAIAEWKKLTEEERTAGIATEYPLEGLSLKGASLKDGILTLEFNDPSNRTGGGSCRVGILWFQIEATAKQFSEVQQVRFMPEELFQP